MANVITNLFGDMALDQTIKSLIQKFGRMSFDTSSSLRVSPTGGTIGTVTTVTTVTTVAAVTQANMTLGDATKAGTLISISTNSFGNTIGSNLVRS